MQSHEPVESRQSAPEKLHHLTRVATLRFIHNIAPTKRTALQLFDYAYSRQYPEAFQQPQQPVGSLALAANEQAQQTLITAAGQRAVETDVHYQAQQQPVQPQMAPAQPVPAQMESVAVQEERNPDPVRLAQASVAAAYEAPQPTPAPVEPAIEAPAADVVSRFEEYLAQAAREQQMENA